MATRISAALQKPKRIATSLPELRYLVFEGMKGDTGDSAYEEAVKLGYAGTEAEWLASLKGAKGDTGFSPEITSSAIPGGHRIDITNELGPDSFNVMDGEDGADGVSPTVQTEAITGGHRVTITDADGAHTFDVFDGDDGSGAVQSVNGQTGVVVLDASDVGALPDSTVIPPIVTEQTVAGWGFTKNTGTYSKPSGGIPKSDLASAVQASLGKADTALQTAPVTSVNNNTGAVTLTASDVGALPSSTSIPTKVSDLTNDSNFQTAAQVQTAINTSGIPAHMAAVITGTTIEITNLDLATNVAEVGA